MAVLIIGAGVVGLSVGWRLCQAGVEVVIVERGEAGSGASTAAAGMLAPTAEVKFEETALLALGESSLEMWPDFAAELHELTGVDLDYRTEGTLVVALDRDDHAVMERLYAYHVELNLPVEKLSGEALREREPGIHPSAAAGLSIPRDHQIDAVRVVEALKIAFLGAGGELRENTEVTKILIEADRACGVFVGEDQILAETVVLAAGAWSRSIEGLPVAQRPYVRPVLGQMLALEIGDPPICEHVIRAPDAYLVPKSAGQLVVGATMEEMGFNDRLTAGGIMDLLRGAWEVIPGVYDLKFEDMWTGFRPVTLDNHPIMGPSPIDGLIYATGHGRGGILLTPITAKLVSELVLNLCIENELRATLSQ